MGAASAGAASVGAASAGLAGVSSAAVCAATAGPHCRDPQLTPPPVTTAGAAKAAGAASGAMASQETAATAANPATVGRGVCSCGGPRSGMWARSEGAFVLRELGVRDMLLTAIVSAGVIPSAGSVAANRMTSLRFCTSVE